MATGDIAGAQAAVESTEIKVPRTQEYRLQIQRLAEENICPMGSCAIMYRTNAQSRAIEDFFVSPQTDAEREHFLENGEIVIRPMMYLALSYDHRIIDGREAVTFLKRICECIEDPERMLLEI